MENENGFSERRHRVGVTITPVEIFNAHLPEIELKRPIEAFFWGEVGGPWHLFSADVGIAAAGDTRREAASAFLCRMAAEFAWIEASSGLLDPYQLARREHLSRWLRLRS